MSVLMGYMIAHDHEVAGTEHEKQNLCFRKNYLLQYDIVNMLFGDLLSIWI